jgi:transposase InsO family protein
VRTPPAAAPVPTTALMIATISAVSLAPVPASWVSQFEVVARVVEAAEARAVPPRAVVEPCAGGAASVPAAPDPAARPVSPSTDLDLATHLDRLRQRVTGSFSSTTPPRDPSWQQPRRLLDQQIRADASRFAQRLRAEGVRATEAARLLNVPARTLRDWQRDLRSALPPTPLGRPHRRCDAEQADAVVAYLNAHGPHVGLPSLRAAFATAPRVELADLQAGFRHLWECAHPRLEYRLHWLVPGSVWAIDFSQTPHRIDGSFAHALAIRDLASGYQLTWHGVTAQSAAEVLAELPVLFTIYGAPLVLKSDNGSAFCAERVQAWLGCWGVKSLFSPPGMPRYNGSIEASIRSLTTRTRYLAERQGHDHAWTSADLEAARQQANTTARPRGAAGPTPEALWQSRRPCSLSERARFWSLAQAREAEVQATDRIAANEVLDHYQRAALDRTVLTSVLVQHGDLEIRRRRIPQRLFGRKAANFR